MNGQNTRAGDDIGGLPYWLAGAAGLLVTVLLLVWQIYQTGSTDLGQHYSLVRFIVDQGAWPTAADRYLGPMAIYPAGAHTVAAILGWVSGSPLLGMHVASLGFLFVVYFAAATLIVRSIDERQALLVALLFIVAVAIGGGARFAFGSEIRVQFYFAQLAGDAVFLVAATLLPSFRSRAIMAFALSAFITLVLATTYPLSAIRFALFVGCWSALTILSDPVRRSTARQWFGLCATLAVLAAIVGLHPAFAAMRFIARHEGSININFNPALLAPVLLVSGAAIWRLGRSGALNPRYGEPLAAAGIAVALAAIAQDIAFRTFGLGSRYAVAKHGYGVGSLVLFHLVVLASVLWRGGLADKLLLTAARVRVFVRTLPGVLAALATLMVVPPSKRTDIIDEMRYEAAVMRLSRAKQPSDLSGNALVLTRDLPIALGLGYSMGILKLDGWGPAVEELYAFYERRFVGVQGAPYAVVSRAEGSTLPDACRVTTTEMLSVIRAACVKP